MGHFVDNEIAEKLVDGQRVVDGNGPGDGQATINPPVVVPALAERHIGGVVDANVNVVHNVGVTAAGRFRDGIRQDFQWHVRHVGRNDPFEQSLGFFKQDAVRERHGRVVLQPNVESDVGGRRQATRSRRAAKDQANETKELNEQWTDIRKRIVILEPPLLLRLVVLDASTPTRADAACDL